MESYEKPRQHIKKQRHHFSDKVPYNQSMVFSVDVSGYESWTIKKPESQRIDAFKLWCWRLESSLDCTEIKLVNPKENQSWIFIGRTDAEAEIPILWPPDVKSQLIRKDPDAGKDWRQEERGWHRVRWLDNITKSMDMNLSKLGEGDGTPLQNSCLENPMDGGAWKAAVHGVAEGRTRLSDFTFTFHFHALEKEMATHSSVFAWRIPGTREPGGLPSMGSHRVGHDWSDLAAEAAVGDSEGQRSLVCFSPWDCKELDMT